MELRHALSAGQGQGVTAPAVTYVATKDQFNLHCSNWVNGTTATGVPQVTFGSRRLHDAGVQWSAVETSKGVFAWTLLDGEANAAVAAGGKCSYLFGFPAAWASTSPATPGPYGNGSGFPPASDTDWTDFITAVMNRHGSKFSFIEGWNEPTVAGFWTGTTSRLIQLQNLMYSTVKALYPSMEVTSPAPTGLNALGMPSQPDYIDLLMAAGMQCDSIAYHAYVNTTSAFTDQMRQLQWFFEAGAQMRTKWKRPVRITENGHQAWTGLTALQQEQLIRRTILLSAGYGIPIGHYIFDNATIGDINNTTGRAWWNDTIASVLGKACAFKSLAPDGTVSITANGATVSF